MTRVPAVLLAVMLLASACGGSSPVETALDDGGDSGSSVPSEPSGAELAAINVETLQAADDPRDQQVLVVPDGSVSSLRDTVTGDRPVLVWFWAPH